jgi:hypothetical protein
MDRLYRLVGICTPVTIVGSVRGRIPITSATAGESGGTRSARLSGGSKKEAVN